MKKWGEVTNRWFFLSFVSCLTASYLIACSSSVFAGGVTCTSGLPEEAGGCAGYWDSIVSNSSTPTDASGNSAGGATTSSSAADAGRVVANAETPSPQTANPGKEGIGSRFKKFVFGDKAAVEAYSRQLQENFQTTQQKCDTITPKPPHSLPCASPAPPVCTNPQLEQACGKKIPDARFNRLQEGAQQKMASLAQSLAGKLGVDSQSILSDINNQGNVNCGKAWQLAKVTCQFPVQALGGKVTKALSTIGKVAITGQAVAGLAGKSLNDLCKALTTLSGAGVTISMLARTKCAFAMRRCQRYCNMEKFSQPGYCNKLYTTAQSECTTNHQTDWRTACASNPGINQVMYSSCTDAHTNMEKYACKVQHINKMKKQCSLLKLATAKMFMDVVQLIQTVRSAKMCWDKTGGNNQSALSPDVCRRMGGTPYTDETTGEQRCRFREPGPGEGVCPPYGVPVSCSQTCEDGSVPAGCPTGVCENGEIVSCTSTCPNGSVPTGCGNTCPDPALTYPNCDCNCPSGQSCNANRQCVTAGGGSCTSTADCEEGQVCQDGACVAPTSCSSADDCEEGEICEDGACVVPTSCSSADDCEEGQICDNGTCAAAGQQACTANNDCGPDKLCHEGQCFCDCHGSPISCSEQCGDRCLEESVNCPCQGDGECTPPQKCVPNANGQNVCSDDDGVGMCPDGSRINCNEVCPDGSRPANCRSCNGDSDCNEGQICNRGTCVEDDPILETDGVEGGGGEIPDNELEDPLAITHDGMGGGDGSDGGGSDDGANNKDKLPSASSGKQKGLLARLGTLLGVGKGRSSGGFRSGPWFGSQRTNQKAKGGDKNSAAKGIRGGGFGGYGAGGGGTAARNPSASVLSAAQKKKKGTKRSAFPSKKLGNIGSVHQDIFKVVTARYKKVYNLK